MTELATSRRTGFRVLTNLWQARRASISWLLILVLLGALLSGVIVSAPWLLWAYNIHQAGKALAVGLSWPTPRGADSLPQVRDRDALQAALGHLAAARHWQPERAFTYRLAGQIYAAQHDWLRAAQEYAQARDREPENPLLAWESALVYEQLEQTVAAAPRENILPDLASALPEALATPISPADCYGQQPGRCFVGLERWSKPYAASPDGPVVTYDTLVMHAPGGIRLTRPIYASHPVLSFMIGLDPNVLNGQSDGATYSLWVETDTESTQVYRRTLDQASAHQGWIPEIVDLTPWAGQTITLVLRLDGGPSGNIQDDWYGWGNVLLTTQEVAQQFTTSNPRLQIDHEISLLSNIEYLIQRGDEELYYSNYHSALNWYKRAIYLAKERQERIEPKIEYIVASLYTGDTNIGTLIEDAEKIYTDLVFKVHQEEIIPGSRLRWLSRTSGSLSYGETLSQDSKEQIGVLWWSGQASAFVEISEQGRYRVTARTRHTSPGPVKMAVGIDGNKLKEFSLDREDNSPFDLKFEIFLDNTYHTIDVWFLNDGSKNGLDRNAVIEWIELKKIP